MKRWFIFIFLVCVSVFSLWEALNVGIKKKYPHILITDTDYGILTELDLMIYSQSVRKGIRYEPFLGKSSDFYYWQCFPTSNVSLKLIDVGYSSEEVGGKENLSDLEILVRDKGNIIHEYEMRSRCALSGDEERKSSWQKIIKDEKYVCISGIFVSKEERKLNGKKVEVYGWLFDKIKTRKGCSSYFEGQCYRT